MPDVFIYDHVRTPRGRGKAGKGGLSNIHPQELLAQVLNHMAARLGLDKNLVEDVSMGCVTQVKEQGACITRNALIAADWPEDVTGYTVNRFCGSGLEALNTIAAKVGGGFIDAGIAGGVESMSRVPMGSDGAMIDGLNEKLRKRLYMVPQGISADLIATMEGFTREDVDRYAAQSQERAAKAWAGGYFKNSVIPVKDQNGLTVLDRDEHMRPDTTVASLGQLNPSFTTIGEAGGFDAVALQKYHSVEKINHVHTPGNSSGIVDGAALVLVGSEKIGKALGLTPRARIAAIATSGADPTIMLTGPIPATRKLLDSAGLSIKDIDLFELNEAFASVVLKYQKEFAIPSEKLNVNGGAIAMGHPLGATGAMILGIVVDELERRKARRAVVTLCVGGGMGVATLVERV
jgi:acetyl-CoA C-acetyltransferase